MENLVNVTTLERMFDLANDNEMMETVATQCEEAIANEKKQKDQQDKNKSNKDNGIGPDGIGIYTSTKMGDSPIVETGDELESENENENENLVENQENGRNGDELGGASGTGLIDNYNNNNNEIKGINNGKDNINDVNNQNNVNGIIGTQENLNGKSNGVNGNNTNEKNGNDGNSLAEQVGMLQQQLKKDISNAVENEAYTVENPSMGGFQ